MFDKQLFRIEGMRGAFVLLLASALIQAALIACQVVSLSHALANLWAQGAISDQVPLLCAFFACFAMRRIVVFAQDELLDSFACKQADRLRVSVLSRVFCKGQSVSREIGTASTAQSVTGGIDDVSRYLRTIPPKLCGVIAISAPLLVALFAIDWVSGVIALVTVPVTGLFMVMLGKQARARAESKFAEGQRLANHFIDTVRGIDTIRALGARARAEDDVRASSEKMRVSTVKTLSVATLSSAVLDLISVFGVAGIAMLLAFRLMDGSIDLATALSALMLSPEFFSPIRSFASDFHASLDGRTALASIFALVDSSCDDEEAPDVEGAPPTAARRMYSEETGFDGCASGGAPSASGAQVPFEAHGISFAYGDQLALSDISFSIEGPCKVGIVGASGAGKSTLIDLIAGFRQPASGAFAIDGEPLDLASDAWRSQLHYIPQNPYLFHMTLDENIRFYAQDASRESIEQAVAATGLDKLVEELPRGIDTIVGEGARNLSGGESQRVALARALLDERPVLLFDEPTAHLDVQTELQLKRHMLACMKGRLVFFATHRLHWVDDMDYVIVLEEGKVAEVGTPRQLLAANGALSRFAASQRSGATA